MLIFKKNNNTHMDVQLNETRKRKQFQSSKDVDVMAFVSLWAIG